MGAQGSVLSRASSERVLSDETWTASVTTGFLIAPSLAKMRLSSVTPTRAACASFGAGPPCPGPATSSDMTSCAQILSAPTIPTGSAPAMAAPASSLTAPTSSRVPVTPHPALEAVSQIAQAVLAAPAPRRHPTHGTSRCSSSSGSSWGCHGQGQGQGQGQGKQAEVSGDCPFRGLSCLSRGMLSRIQIVAGDRCGELRLGWHLCQSGPD